MKKNECEYEDDNGEFLINNLDSTPDITDKIDSIWEDFKEDLGRSQNKINPSFFAQRKKSAFDEIIYAYFEYLSDSVEQLEEAGIDQFVTNNFEGEINDIINTHEIDDSEKFEEVLKSYLSDPGEELSELIDTIYTGAINLNILSKTSDIPFEEITGDKTGNLFLDTNTIINLYCKNSRYHGLTRVLCERTTELGYDLYYLPSTVHEITRVVNGSKAEMNELTNPENEPIKSPLTLLLGVNPAG